MNGAVVVAAGSNQINLNVVIQDDDVAEPSEDSTVTLSGGGGVDLVDAVGVATILDDDVADLSLTTDASPTIVAPGEDITYNIIVSNAGPGDADNVVVEDILAADLEREGELTTDALEVGYRSPSAFIAMFGRTVGLTPRQWAAS